MERKLKKAQKFYGKKMQELIDLYYANSSFIEASSRLVNLGRLEKDGQLLFYDDYNSGREADFPERLPIVNIIIKIYFLKFYLLNKIHMKKKDNNEFMDPFFYKLHEFALMLLDMKFQLATINIDLYKYVTKEYLQHMHKGNSIISKEHELDLTDDKSWVFMCAMEALANISKVERHFELIGIEDSVLNLMAEYDYNVTDVMELVGPYWVGILDDFIAEEIDEHVHSQKKEGLHRTIYVMPKSIFSVLLMLDIGTFDDSILRQKTEILVKPFSFPGLISDCRSFYEYFVCIIINFHIVHGNFSKIKICSYDKCRKIFYESYSGKMYCCDDCRIKASREKEPKKKMQCRDRQNHWLTVVRDKESLTYYVEDTKAIGMKCCKNCEEEKYANKSLSKGGYCEEIWVKNWETLIKISKDVKRVRKILKII